MFYYKKTSNNYILIVEVTTETNNLALHRGRQMRDVGAYGCAVPGAYDNRNRGHG